MTAESPVEPFKIELPMEAVIARTDAKGNPWKVAGRLFNVAKEKLLAAITLPTREEVIKAAGEAFDKYVARSTSRSSRTFLNQHSTR